MAFILVKELLSSRKEDLGLLLIAGETGLKNKIRAAHTQKPGLALVGYNKHIVSHRIQIFGKTEIGFLAQQDEGESRAVLSRFFNKRICCCVVTGDMEPHPLLLEYAKATQTPLIRTSLVTQDFTYRLTRFLSFRFARRTTMHGVLVDVYGAGVLILGKSAIGKSECALDLVLKGHRLVADDVVELRRISQESINGRSSEVTKNHMEIRGLGIINIKEMLGIGAVRDRKKVHMVVKLVEWSDAVDYDRIGLDDEVYQILGVELPLTVIPVRPGRNLTAIVEVAARNHLLKLEGFHAARSFQEQLKDRISRYSLDGPEDCEEAE